MQSNKKLVDTSKTTVKKAILDHEDNIQALMSSNSGTEFPSEPVEGMHCYRTDLKHDYVYIGNGEWKAAADMNDVDAKIQGINESLKTKQDVLTFDSSPKLNSNNPVTSDGVWSALNSRISRYGDNINAGLGANYFFTGSDDNTYIQTRKLRGEGKDKDYRHAIDLGTDDSNKVDFYEAGGEWNFYQNEGGTSDSGVLVGSIKSDGWHGNVIGNASSATKAVQDGNGNVIADTYATKEHINEGINTKSLVVTGETYVPTPNEGNNSKVIANTEFVQMMVAKLVDSSPETLNTLNELANALGNDPNFATTVSKLIGEKESKTDANIAHAMIQKSIEDTNKKLGEISTIVNSNQLQRNKAYAVGDIAYSPNLPSYLYLECVTAGTTGATEPDFSNIKLGGGNN